MTCGSLVMVVQIKRFMSMLYITFVLKIDMGYLWPLINSMLRPYTAFSLLGTFRIEKKKKYVKEESQIGCGLF